MPCLPVKEKVTAGHGYGGSYRSLWREVRTDDPRPKCRSCRRVEHWPGPSKRAGIEEIRGCIPSRDSF